MVLRKGLWFIGEQFLSTTNVSSIVVWIRPNELPIEYYEVEVLKKIGNSIGEVLQIDTHNAAEVRGRFARLCVQVDVDKPLVTNILIGAIHQPVNYEGVHRPCFSCGRIGDWKEACLYTLQSFPKSYKDNDDSEDGPVSNSHEGCDLVDLRQGEAPQSLEKEDAYGPWVVVTKKRQGNRGVRNKLQGSGTGYLRVSGGIVYLRVDKRKSEEAQPSRDQSPKATVSTDNGLNSIDFSKGATFPMDLNKSANLIKE